jgi:MerR family copper efflux transcriptional regulator
LSTQAINSPHLLRIGDLARLTGKTVRAIHLYEEQGLLQPATRTSGGFRLYEENAIERVRWIELLHELGFSLNEMRDLLRSWWSAGLGPEAMSELRALFTRKLEHAREMITRYQQLERELIDGLRYLETCRVCATPSTVKVCVHCTQDHGMSQEPALVAGLITSPGSTRRSTRGLVRIEDIGQTGGTARVSAPGSASTGKESA